MSELKTILIKQAFQDHGLSIAEWARRNGFSVPLAYQVLSGRKKCLRGQSHAIAIALGLKSGSEPDFDSLTRALKSMNNNHIVTPEDDRKVSENISEEARK